jgi:hypothetical protein
MSTNFISPTGSVELDNDCTYSIDKRNVRSRETVVPSEDLAFYFKEYIEPKYGLGNINVSNVASFMKDLEMNWTKLSPPLKDKVVDIMVDGILNNPTSDYNFKNKLLTKLGINEMQNSPVLNSVTVDQNLNKSTFGNSSVSQMLDDNSKTILLTFVCVIALYIIADTVSKPKPGTFRKTV